MQKRRGKEILRAARPLRWKWLEEYTMANEKILVVDDDQNICELLRLYLTKEGF